MIPGIGFIVMLACIVFYYRVGEVEYSSGIPLGCVSLLLWLVAAYLLHLGFLGCLLVQGGLFAALTAWNMVGKKQRY